jgi:signal transduction histidine kinase
VTPFPAEGYANVYGRDITERKRAEERILWQNAVLNGINRIFRETLSSNADEDLGRICLSVAEEVTESKFGFFDEIGPDGYLHDLAISDPGWEACAMYDKTGHRRPPGTLLIHGIYGRVVVDAKSLIVNDPSSHPDRIGVPEGHPPLTAFLGVPLIREGKTIGMIAVGNREGGYRAQDQEALEALAPAIVESFGRKQAEEALRERTLQLQQLTDTLEQQVQERTEELEVTNEELRTEIDECQRVETELTKSQSDLRRLSVDLLNAQEKERKLVAGEIHDSIGSSLSAVKFKVESALTELADRSPQTTTALKSLIPIVQGAADEARRIQMNLRPSTLDDLGLLATIRWLCRQFESTYSAIGVKQNIKIEEHEVPDSLKTVIFRIMQEGLNNIAKHSRANMVLLFLQKTEQAIKLAIRDNGQGFDLSKGQSPSGTPQGLGLKSMRERAELSGGSFEMESTHGKGTVIRVWWPLPAK